MSVLGPKGHGSFHLALTANDSIHQFIHMQTDTAGANGVRNAT